MPLCIYIHIHDFFFLLKNKIAIPMEGGSQQHSAVAAGAMPSLKVRDMQDKGKGSLPAPSNMQQGERVFLFLFF